MPPSFGEQTARLGGRKLGCAPRNPALPHRATYRRPLRGVLGLGDAVQIWRFRYAQRASRGACVALVIPFNSGASATHKRLRPAVAGRLWVAGGGSPPTTCHVVWRPPKRAACSIEPIIR